MDDVTALRIMDALAEKIEALAERLAEAEKRVMEKCSCEKWASNFSKNIEQPTNHD